MLIKKAMGFTLVELLIVVSIIGILLTIMTISWGSIVSREHDNTKKLDLGRINANLSQYYADQHSYPTFNTTLPVNNCTNFTVNYQLSALVPKYVTSLPIDPSSSLYTGDSYCDQSNQYLYLTPTSGPVNGYKLLAHLENKGDTDIVSNTPFNSTIANYSYTYYSTDPHYNIDSNYIVSGGSNR